jgi:hypothetical protein
MSLRALSLAPPEGARAGVAKQSPVYCTNFVKQFLPFTGRLLRQASMLRVSLFLATTCYLNCVRERFFHAAEIEKSGNKDQDGNDCRNPQGNIWAGARAKERPAESIHDTGHGIQ